MGFFGAGEQYDEAGGNPDPVTAAQMVQSGNVYGTPVTGPVADPVAFARAAYAAQGKWFGVDKSIVIGAVVALGALYYFSKHKGGTAHRRRRKAKK